MFLKMWQKFQSGMGDAYEARPVVVALGAIDRIEHVRDGAGVAVRLVMDAGETIICLGTVDQVCEAISRLTGGEGLQAVASCPSPAATDDTEAFPATEL